MYHISLSTYRVLLYFVLHCRRNALPLPPPPARAKNLQPPFPSPMRRQKQKQIVPPPAPYGNVVLNSGDKHQGYIALAVRLGTDEAFRRRATTRVEEGYRLSLHKNEQSGNEWASFFRRAIRAAGFDGGPKY